jgi:hypothetical protein
MIEYLKKCHGFEDDNVVILMDDGEHTEPTSANIIAAYKQIVADSEPGDAVFCHYSGTCSAVCCSDVYEVIQQDTAAVHSHLLLTQSLSSQFILNRPRLLHQGRRLQ